MDCWNQSFTAYDLAEATGGFVDKRMVQNWHARNQWLTPTRIPEAGKAYTYGFAHLLEAMIVAELARLGFTHDLARDVIVSRIKSESSSGRRSDLEPRQLPSLMSKLRDFNKLDRFWVIVPKQTDRGEPTVVSSTLALAPEHIPDLAPKLLSFVVLNVAALVVKARAIAENPPSRRTRRVMVFRPMRRTAQQGNKRLHKGRLR